MSETSNPVRPPAVGDLYRAVWRWHFYAGLLVLLFLISLSLTSALDAVPGTALKYLDPANLGASAEVTVGAEDGKMAVYLDRYSGLVLGAMPDRTTLMWTVRTLHGFKYFGTSVRYLIDIASVWSTLLVGTGINLWWPRGQTGGVVSVRGAAKAPGVLAVTGMPWSGVWCAKVNEWANGRNFGYPDGVRVNVPMSGQKLDAVSKMAWSLEQAQIPVSHRRGTPVTLDAAVATFDRLGLHRGYAVALPTRPEGVFSGSVYPDDLRQHRVVHLDQYSGQPLLDVSYAEYEPLGTALEWGINTHLGQTCGLWNKLVLLAACAAIVLLAVSAAVMWWKRRPSGSLGVPPLPQDRRVFRGLLAILAVGVVLFPLLGATLVVMLALDMIWVRMARRSRAVRAT